METLVVFLNVQLKISLRIGNLQMLLEIGLFKKKEKKKKEKRKKKEHKVKEIKVWAIPIPISTTKDLICCSNGYIYHFLDYIRLLLFVNANVIHHV